MDYKYEISVIIPSFKPGDYLWDCLDSLVKQTYDKEKMEIIIILNGCNEPYLGNIKNYIIEKMRGMIVTIIQTNEGGVSNARNIGLDVALGHYIAFIDDDDYVSTTYLQRLYDVAIEGYVPLSNQLAFDDGTTIMRRTYLSDAFDRISRKDHCGIFLARRHLSNPVTKLVDREIIGDVRFNTHFVTGEDNMFMFEISYRMNHFKASNPDAIYYRRNRQGSAIHNLLNSSISEYVAENWRSFVAITKIYLKRPFKYNSILYLTKVLGGIRQLPTIIKKACTYSR